MTRTQTSVSNAFDALQTVQEWEKATGVTREQVDKAIPEHLKHRSILRSLASLGRDAAYAAIVAAVFHGLAPFVSAGAPLPLRVAFWTTYSVIMGTVTTGLWVIGHECGHGAFSSSAWVNDLVGFLAHTPLLVPYFAWQFSHGKHHKWTNHMTQGETHVPPTKATWLHKTKKVLPEASESVLDIVLHLTFGWPLYLAMNLTGGRVNWKGERLNKGRAMSHFVAAGSEVFPPQWHSRVNLSSLGFFGVLALLALWARSAGSILPVLQWYLGPLMVTNAWLVLYTWLQHTHEAVPHLGGASYNWLRGALSTVDRPYPALIDHLHHHIGTTHVLHHLNSRIPHYHAPEATKHLRRVLGPLYRYDSRGIVEAMWTAAKSCHFVDGVEGVQFYKVYEPTGNKKAL